MPDRIVLNTGPILALIAATSSLEILRELYREVNVPVPVVNEIMDGKKKFGQREFQKATFINRVYLDTGAKYTLWDTLDPGEASVIQAAIALKINTVAIDETSGRRIAKLYGLNLTGSLGILLRAKERKLIPSLKEAIEKMKTSGIWLSDSLIARTLEISGEK